LGYYMKQQTHSLEKLLWQNLGYHIKQ
jgi:hypothetical protein